MVHLFARCALAICLCISVSVSNATVRGYDERKPGSFDAHVLIYLKNSNAGPHAPCSGTAITRTHVLTAAHCFQDEILKATRSGIVSNSKVIVPACRSFPGGAVFGLNEYAIWSRDHTIKNGTVQYDAALIRLDRPICEQSLIARVPEQIPDEGVPIDTGIRHYGWYHPNLLPKGIFGDHASKGTWISAKDYGEFPDYRAVFAEGVVEKVNRQPKGDANLILHWLDTEQQGSGGGYLARVLITRNGTSAPCVTDLLVGHHIGSVKNYNYGREFSGDLIEWVKEELSKHGESFFFEKGKIEWLWDADSERVDACG